MFAPFAGPQTLKIKKLITKIYYNEDKTTLSLQLYTFFAE